MEHTTLVYRLLRAIDTDPGTAMVPLVARLARTVPSVKVALLRAMFSGAMSEAVRQRIYRERI